MKLKIGIIGTRGIPNQYGGFEQFAECVSAGLVNKGHEVFVYNSHSHLFQEKIWNGVNIIHCYDPEDKLGTIGQFIYDLNCLRDARKRDFDVLLILGYTSISIWGRLFPKKAAIVINMDGLEWKRSKYSKITQRFLLYAERLAIKYSNFYISDSTAIQTYLLEKYKIKSRYIAYSAEILHNENEKLLEQYNITKGHYYLLMARMEPENNIEPVLEGFSKSNSNKKLILIGSTSNKFGRYLVSKFGGDKRIHFAGALYDARLVHSLKLFSCLYFHGHSVGGTNPSLLEAMASRAAIVAHDNEFNRAILLNNALYFKDQSDVRSIIETEIKDQFRERIIDANVALIEKEYSPQQITDSYEIFLIQCYKAKNV